MAVVSIAVDEPAEQLYVDPGDVRVIPAALTDEPIADAVSDELSGEVRMILDGSGFRTTPQLRMSLAGRLVIHSAYRSRQGRHVDRPRALFRDRVPGRCRVVPGSAAELR